jgi:hypothetical protein
MAKYTEYKISKRYGDGRVVARFYRTDIGQPYTDETGFIVTPVSRTLLEEREYHLARYTNNDIRDFLDEQLPSFVAPGWPVLPKQATRQPRDLSVVRNRDIQTGRNPDARSN